MSKFYNETLKNEFLQNGAGDNKDEYGIIFKVTESIEAKYNKDLCNFNQTQLEEVLETLNSEDGENIKLISNYIEFSIEQGHVSSCINLAYLMSDEDEE